MRDTRYVIKQDDCGYYVVWYSTRDVWRKESLRTRNRFRAMQWGRSGVCHGVSDHDKVCPKCDMFPSDDE